MSEIFSSLFEKYYESICDFLQTFSANTWILIGLTFIALIIKLPLLLVIPLSYGSYLATENDTIKSLISENISISPELLVLSVWLVCIFIKFFTFKRNNKEGISYCVKNLLSFSLVFVLTITVGTPAFKSTIFKEFQYVIILCIFLYASFNIFKHSIKLLKNGFATFAWVLIITILGIQYNSEYIKNFFKDNKLQSLSAIKSAVNYDIKNSIKNKLNNTTNVKTFIINEL